MLDSLCRLDQTEPWEIIATNNGSTDDTPNILAAYERKLPLTVLSEPRPGKNRALNRAVAIAQGDLIVFTDDDIIAEPGWLSRLREVADAHAEFDVFGGRIVPCWSSPPPPVILRNAPLGVTYAITPEDQTPGPVSPGRIWGPNMAVRKRVFDAGHKFDESVGPAGRNYVMGSETEFTTRVEKFGYRSWFDDEACVQHIVRPEQVRPDWVVKRAHRFGRNQWMQTGGTERGAKIFGIPRWRFSSYGAYFLRSLKARLSRDEDQLFNARWQMSFLRGYLSEAWRRRRSGSP